MLYIRHTFNDPTKWKSEQECRFSPTFSLIKLRKFIGNERMNVGWNVWEKAGTVDLLVGTWDGTNCGVLERVMERIAVY